MRPFDRAANLRRLADERFDVLVVGGGITGAGVALDATTRGLRTAIVERDDFASGTSSKSSKLVHGGLRYLEQREFHLVYEALAERQVLLRNAPHLVRVMPFLIPIISKNGLLNPKLSRALGTAMWLYDLTGGLRVGKLHERISKDEALRHMPTLPAEHLHSAYLYYDAQADDARLTLAIVRTAAIEHGAVAANRAAVVGLVKDGARVRGARVLVDGEEIEVRADAVVNAAGVWADAVRALDEGADPQSIRPAKGVHITVPWELVRNDIAAIVPVPKDRRSIFVIPWGDFTYVGTTDTDYDGPLDDPQCDPDDIAYLLRAVNAARSERPITEADIVGTWAGLRPLLQSAANARTADLSRRHAVLASPSGVITITGGKLTTYRRMAADTVDAVMEHLGRGDKSRTKRLTLIGAADPELLARDGVPRHLATRFGSEARFLLGMIDADPTLAAPVVPGLPYVRAEVVYAARHEMAGSVDDVLSRRTRARILARDASAAAAREVASLLGPELGWSAAEQRRQANHYRSLVATEREAAGLPETALDHALGA